MINANRGQQLMGMIIMDAQRCHYIISSLGIIGIVLVRMAKECNKGPNKWMITIINDVMERVNDNHWTRTDQRKGRTTDLIIDRKNNGDDWILLIIDQYYDYD